MVNMRATSATMLTVARMDSAPRPSLSHLILKDLRVTDKGQRGRQNVNKLQLRKYERHGRQHALKKKKVLIRLSAVTSVGSVQRRHWLIRILPPQRTLYSDRTMINQFPDLFRWNYIPLI